MAKFCDLWTCFANGQWVNTTRVLPYRHKHISGLECPLFESERHENDPQPVHRHGWEWRPSSSDMCPIPDWDPKTFCSALAGRNIVVIGDSLMREFAETLSAMLKAGPLSPVPLNSLTNTSRLFRRVEFDSLNPISHLIHFRFISKNLCGTNRSLFYCCSYQFGERSDCYQRVLNEAAPRSVVLVLGFGAHYNAVDDAWRVFKIHLGQDIPAFLNAHQVVIDRVLFLTIPPGAPHCQESLGPLRTLPSRASAIIPMIKGSSENYHWELLFDVRNTTLSLLPRLGIPVMDVFAILGLRPDMHPYRSNRIVKFFDCLHYCMIPGPFDVIVQMFTALLPVLPVFSPNS